MPIGYTIQIIPEHREKSCFGCDFYKHDMTRTGHNPTFSNTCTHPNAPMPTMLYGNMRSNKTPDWCPVGEQIQGDYQPGHRSTTN